MASHHHHQCQNCVPNSICATTCCCNHHCCHSSPSLPTQFPIDPLLLQALTSLLLQQQQQQQQQPNLYPPNPNRTCSCTHKNHHQERYFKPKNQHFQQTHSSVLSSLLQRINTLESSLQHISTSRDEPHYFFSPSSNSLKEAAARVIQTHFRAFLVRRSRTLSQLKDLAFIKSSFNSLKSSISKKTHFYPDLVSHKAKDLLLKLNFIQGSDPMIRDGKRSLGRDLVKFLEFIDGFTAKRYATSHKSVKNVKLIRNRNESRGFNIDTEYGNLSAHQREIVGNLRDRVEKIEGLSRACENDEEDVELEGFQQFINNEDDVEDIGGTGGVSENGDHLVIKLPNGVLVKGASSQPRVKKAVSFNENGNAYMVYEDTDESVLNGDGSLSDESDYNDRSREVVENQIEAEERKTSSKNSKKGEEANFHNGGPSLSSYGERNPRRNLRNDGDAEISGYCWDQDGNLVFSAPMPVKMESRTDLMKKKKTVHIVT